MFFYKIFFLPSLPLKSKNLLPNKPGLYYAVQGWRVLYIGKAETSLRSRWQNHHKFQALSKIRGVRLYYELVPKWRIADEEARLIQRWKPSMNGRVEKRKFWVQVFDWIVLIGFLMVVVWILF